jgi:hypothetical protein
MKALVIALPVLFAGLASCDKAKQAVEAARVKMGGVTDPDAPATPGGEVAPAYATHVDSAAEGVRFRRDLTFPSQVKVRVSELSQFKNVRIVSKSELGSEASTYTGSWERVGTIERHSQRVTLAIEKAGEVLDLPKGEEKAGLPAPPKKSLPAMGTGTAGSRIVFEHGPKGWQRPAGKGPVEFGNLLLERSLLPALPDVLVREGVLPRTQWFSSTRRWIGGDKFVLEGPSMALLFPGRSSGTITLTYEAAEALAGHPCGRFAVEGDVTLKDHVGLGGETSEREITIRSGKIWCSLIHPLVLREELQTVQTLSNGSGEGGASLRIQGAIDLVVARQWNP